MRRYFATQKGKMMTSAMHTAVTGGNSTLIALDAKGKPISGAPKISAKTGDWNDGHPGGALLEKDHEFDATRLSATMRIYGWQVQDSTRRDVGSFQMFAPLVIEPGTMIKLTRAVLVPRVIFEA